jgi:hypothetical protein
MEGRDHRRSHQASKAKLLQRRQQRVQAWLLGFRHSVRPAILSSSQHAAGVPRQLIFIIAEVEPTLVPPAVRRDEASQDVQIRPARPHLQDAAPYSSRAQDALLPRLLSEELGLEKVKPQVLLRLHPKVALADRRKDGGLRDDIGARW